MVFQKSLDYGSIGYQIPKMPRFPRSVRGKPLPSKKVEVNQMRPFDMLATVAEDLLGKKDNDSPLFGTTEITAPISTVKQEQFDNGSPSKSDVFDQGSCDESIFVSRCDSQCLIPFNFEEKTATSVLALAKCDGTGPDAGIHSLEDPVEIDTKATALVSSDSSVEISPIGDRRNAGNIELLVDRDDDENSSGRSNCRNIYTMPIKSHCTGDGRVRKMMASNSWNASQEARKGELWNDGEVKHVFHSRKLCYTRQRTKRSSFKRRKLSERCSFSASNGAFCSKGASDSLGKDAHGRSSSKLGHVSYESVDNHVKLSIKSFRVPEIFIEIPANATVGSLKRTVLEAVTAILSGGLRVGVLLQGKKIRDDNKTILQAGISNVDKLATLGFTLEPNPTQAHHNSRFCEPESLNKFHAPPPGLDHGTPNAPDVREYCTESVHDLVHSPTNPLSSVDNDNSKALIPVHSVNPEVLTIVPFSNSKRSEMVQRRIRRPFSVSEVEALVVAVEKLGTGRWRDVKLRAFDGAKHRTYVDLKDKWKTLVHTARISPQQRRGEPVPQALLDRVLSTHDYWSRQQAKSACLAEQCLRSAQA